VFISNVQVHQPPMLSGRLLIGLNEAARG